MTRQLVLMMSVAVAFGACGKKDASSDKTEAKTAEAKPAEAKAKPAEAKAKPAEAKAKPAEAVAKPAEAKEQPAEAKAKPADVKPATAADLKNPASIAQTAPESFKVKMDTSKGSFVIEVFRKWAPNGADRFYSLVQAGYFNDVRFFRVIAGFMAQFGIHGDPAVATAWRPARISDDPVVESNKRGYLTFATAGPNTRTTQLFINFRDNIQLDRMGFAPIGKVISGMEIVDAIHSGYGEGAPRGRGPMQGRVQAEGNSYLEKDFPDLDYIKSATVIN